MENWPILSINLIMKKVRKHSSFMRCRSNNQIKSTFETNQLQLPPTIRIEIRGQERKKTFFIFALFSTTAEARTFESPTAEVRRRGVSKLKTNRMEPSNEALFPLITWQSALDKLKVFAKERVREFKSSHKGKDELIAKNLPCEERINNMRCWKQYDLRTQRINKGL